MKVYFWPDDRHRIPKQCRAIAVGIFDGVHRGHKRILNRILRSRGSVPMVVTFDPHPGKVLHPREFHPTILMALRHRLKVFERMGVRETLVIRFNKSFSRIPAKKFLSDILLKQLGLKKLSVGHDFRFGHRGLGDRNLLLSERRRTGFVLTESRPLRYKNEPISSTRIRRAIEKGDLSDAGRMLGRPVSVYGTVVRGRGRGRKLGFPTANLNPHHEALPPSGVYAAYGVLGRKTLKGVIHIGERPTFKDRQPTLEVHFFNFHNDIYGRELELFFADKIRPIRCFESPQALSEAIGRDAAAARKTLDKRAKHGYNFLQL